MYFIINVVGPSRLIPACDDARTITELMYFLFKIYLPCAWNFIAEKEPYHQKRAISPNGNNFIMFILYVITKIFVIHFLEDL